MENNLPRHGRASSIPLKQRRSGYEPSDTETDWQESPQHDLNGRHGVVAPRSPRMDSELNRDVSPLRHSRRHSSRLEDSSPKRDTVSSALQGRPNSRSPFKARKDDGSHISPIPGHRNVNPFSKAENGRQFSPYKYRREEQDMHNDEIIGSNRRKTQRTPTGKERGSHRSTTAPRTRTREREQEISNSLREQKWSRNPSPLARNMFREQEEMGASHRKAPSMGKLNEMVANIKMSRAPVFNAPNLDSTDSIGDVFFSRDHAALAMKNNGLPKSSKVEADFYIEPILFPTKETVLPQNIKVDHNPPRTLTTSASLASQSREKLSMTSSKMSDTSGRSFSLFTANRGKCQADGWFSCMRKGPCNTKSPEKQRQDFGEESFIQRAFVVESLRRFWADEYQPRSLSGFVCHKQEAQLLSQLVSHNSIPHILLKGPPGSGKRALAMALLGELFGDACWNTSHDLRYFQVREKRATQVVVPITSSAQHLELNANSEPNAKYALMGLVKEISNNYALTPEVSNINFKPDYKVMVLYQVDKAAENIQHLVKWIMDCYTDACKLIICCEDDKGILEAVKNRCKVIEIGAPGNHEIMEILVQIARKEDYDLPKSFAAKIAAKSKQNLRDAIMALEACKAHNYPFADDQPIPFAWEDVLVKLAAEILSDPSPKRLFLVREKLHKLLADFVHPKLILLKLVEQFLKGAEANSKRELYYWHAYYEKRLPTGAAALLKLEEFVAKFMSINRKSMMGNLQYM